jgi:hypothetical protein
VQGGAAVTLSRVTFARRRLALAPALFRKGNPRKAGPPPAPLPKTGEGETVEEDDKKFGRSAERPLNEMRNRVGEGQLRWPDPFAGGSEPFQGSEWIKGGS